MEMVETGNKNRCMTEALHVLRRKLRFRANTRTKSIPKQIKSKYPELGSEKPLASKSCFV